MDKDMDTGTYKSKYNDLDGCSNTGKGGHEPTQLTYYHYIMTIIIIIIITIIIKWQF